MCALRKHPVDTYRTQYNLTAFIETGTCFGASVLKVIHAGYTEVFTCEVGAVVIARAREHFVAHAKDALDRIHVYHGKSTDMLPRMLKDAAHHQRALVYLDAHSDPALFIAGEVSTANDLPSIMPLQQEIDILLAGRDIVNDVIVIDDLHLIVPPYWTGSDRPELPLNSLPRNPLYGSVDELAKVFPHHRATVVKAEDYTLLLEPTGV